MNRKRRGGSTRSKEEATNVARNLILLAASTAGSDLELAKEQSVLARRIMLKANVRLPWQLKRFYCHGCKGLLVPGVNARVRLGLCKMLLVTCKGCGRVNRKRLRQA